MNFINFNEFQYIGEYQQNIDQTCSLFIPVTSFVFVIFPFRIFTFGLGANICQIFLQELSQVTHGRWDFIPSGERLQPRVCLFMFQLKLSLLQDFACHSFSYIYSVKNLINNYESKWKKQRSYFSRRFLLN